MTEKDETKAKPEKSSESLEQRVTRLESIAAMLNRKRKDMSGNWKTFCDSHVGAQADDGKMVGRVRIALIGGIAVVTLIASMVFAGSRPIVSYDDAVGNVVFEITTDDDGTADVNVYGDLGVTGSISFGSVSTTIISNDMLKVYCDDLEATGTVTIADDSIAVGKIADGTLGSGVIATAFSNTAANVYLGTIEVGASSPRYPILGPDDTTSLMAYGWTNTIAAGTHTHTFSVAFSAVPIAVVVQYAADPGSGTNKIFAAQATWATTQVVVTADTDVLYTGIAIGAK